MNNKLLNYNLFLEAKKTKILPEGLPKEVSESALIISKGMYEKVNNYSFYKDGDDFFIRFGLSDSDFKYIDPKEILPLDLTYGSMGKRQYYVELEYDDEYPSTKEVSYKIVFVPMTPDKYSKKEKEKEYIDEYEQRLKEEEEDSTNIFDIE